MAMTLEMTLLLRLQRQIALKSYSDEGLSTLGIKIIIELEMLLVRGQPTQKSLRVRSTSIAVVSQQKVKNFPEKLSGPNALLP